tara:strand:- start:114 stop:470 length:357 start_codon:yes stop_codon:yes gene_type:complete
MAHFAEINGSNIVIRVIVVNNDECLDGEGNESEAIGVARCVALFGGTWVQTSYNNRIRKNYAGVGYTWDSTRDAFIPVQPFASWTLDETTCRWEAPVAFPDDGNKYKWDESVTNWIQV